MIGTCQFCGAEYIQTYTLLYACPNFCHYADARVRSTAIEAQRTWCIVRRNTITPGHTAEMNARYGLDEDVWPSHISTGDVALLTLYQRLSEADTRRYTQEMIHVHQRELFAICDEIERRGLLLPEKRQDTRVSRIPWEQPDQPIEIKPGAFRDVMQELEATLLDGIGWHGGGPWNNEQGRQGKVGGLRVDDEEMLGIYRREHE